MTGRHLFLMTENTIPFRAPTAERLRFLIKTKALSLNCLREILIIRIYILLHYNMYFLRMLCLKRIIGEVIRFFVLKHKTEKYLRINGSHISVKE